MLRDITLGQYYPVESPIHKLDPRVKLFCTLIFLVSLFVTDNFIGYIPAAVFLASVIILSSVPFKYMVKGMRGILFLLLLSVVFNIFLVRGDVLVSFWKLSITKQGIQTAGFMAIRLSFLVIGSSVMTLTTTPNQLTDGLEKGLGFLQIIKVPVHEIAMMMSIALRFIPILVEETDKIMKAQMARGADFESGNIFKKIKSLIPLLVPLFVSAFRRANDLAMAMEARGYRGGEGRTRMKPLKYGGNDAFAYVIIFFYLAVIISIRVVF